MARIRRITWTTLLIAGAAGCTQQVSVDAWRNTMEEFAVRNANGEMTFLQMAASDSTKAQFVIVNDKSPDSSTDMAGVLLGRRAVMGREWYIFLLGTVKERNIDDVRIAIRADDDRTPSWLVSSADPPALHAYQRSKAPSKYMSQPEGKSNPPYTHFNGFPSEEDSFRLDIAGNTVSVTEEQSGARWTLVVPGKSHR